MHREKKMRNKANICKFTLYIVENTKTILYVLSGDASKCIINELNDWLSFYYIYLNI